MNKIRRSWYSLIGFLYEVFGQNFKWGCGHVTKKKTFVTSPDGDSWWFHTRAKGDDYCSECFKEAMIVCAWGEKLIAPGDPVTLYTPRDPDFRLPEGAAIYKEKPRPQMVGCLRWDCADTGADRTGFWVMPGKVERVVSPMEMAMASNDVVIVSDLSNINEAIPIHDE